MLTLGCAPPVLVGEPQPGGGGSTHATATTSPEPTTRDAPRTGAAVTPPAGARQQPRPAAAPTRLRVPSIGLDEPLIDLGLTADGTLDVPAEPGEVGWFTGGGTPGGRGPTVLAGHVDSTRGPAVFARLTELRVGDTVEVDTEDGRTVTYQVDRVADHPKEDFPTVEVFGATATDQLRLVTCTGFWDPQAGSYVDNRVVHASPVG